MAAGIWRHHELFDGTYDCGDLIDVLEFLDTKEENERRYSEWKEANARVAELH